MTHRIFAAAFAAGALISSAALAQEEGEPVEEPVAAAEPVVASVGTESASEILGKPKLLPATAKLPDGACNDGMYQEAAFFLVLPAEAPEAGDALTLADFTDPRTGESVAEAKGFNIVKRKSDFTVGEGAAARTAYTYYLAFDSARDCD